MSRSKIKHCKKGVKGHNNYDVIHAVERMENTITPDELEESFNIKKWSKETLKRDLFY